MTRSHVITFYNNDHDACLVKFINLGYAPLLVSDKKYQDYFEDFQGVYRFWSFKRMDWVTTWDYEIIDISISAPDAHTDWIGVQFWLSDSCGGINNNLPLIKPVKLVTRDAIDEERKYTTKIHDQNMDQYFYEEVIQDNTFFAVIKKPLTDRPYTIVIDNWTPDKMIFMFSSICSVPSFGVLYPHDRNFIVSLWKWKNMSGDFNLNELSDKHVSAVKAGEIHEPIVYRLSGEDVRNIYLEKKWGVGEKRNLQR